MASIQSLGAGSGLLTSELVEDIVAAEREATDLRIESRRAEIDAKISAFGGVRSALESLGQAASALGDSESVLSHFVTSSNPAAVSATAGSLAQPGIHAVEVLSLARAHTLTTGSYEGLDSQVGQGTLTFEFGSTTFDGNGQYSDFIANAGSSSATITIDATNDTLAGVKDAINNADIGVSASIINDGNGYVLVLKSDATGVAESMQITVQEGAVAGLDALAFNQQASTAGVNLTQTVAADDAVVSVDGILVRRSGNSIEEVIPGITLNALALNPGAPATISIAQDSAEITARMQTFVDAFNDVKALTDELTSFDAESGQGSLLTGDATVRTIRTQMQRFLGASLAGLSSSAFDSLVDIGLTTDQDADYFLTFDAEKFARALDNDADAVRALLTRELRASDAQIQLSATGSQTVAGSYDVEITQVASRGYYQSLETPGLAGPITIDADNDALAFEIDGVATGPLALAQGSYSSGAELAAEIENRINGAAAMAAAGTTVRVSFDSGADQLRIESERFGSRSSVAITELDTNTTASIGLQLADGQANAGVDVAGTINGVQGQGSGLQLRIAPGPAAATSGRLDGTELPSFPVEIQEGSNQLSLRIDGESGDALTIPAGTYSTGGELAQALESAINGDPQFSELAKSIDVRFDPGQQRLSLVANSSGTDSEVAITAIDTVLQNALGLSIGTGQPGSPAGRRDDPAGGIEITVSGGEPGARGSVTLVRGVMSQLDRFLSSTLNAAGTFSTKVDGLNDRLLELETESRRFNTRMDLLEDRLRLQFAAADALISQFNSTSQFLDRELTSITTPRKGG